jgi:hypothetical protein
MGIVAGRPLRAASSMEGARGDAAILARHFRTVASQQPSRRAIA